MNATVTDTDDHDVSSSNALIDEQNNDVSLNGCHALAAAG